MSRGRAKRSFGKALIQPDGGEATAVGQSFGHGSCKALQYGQPRPADELSGRKGLRQTRTETGAIVSGLRRDARRTGQPGAGRNALRGSAFASVGLWSCFRNADAAAGFRSIKYWVVGVGSETSPRTLIYIERPRLKKPNEKPSWAHLMHILATVADFAKKNELAIMVNSVILMVPKEGIEPLRALRPKGF